MRDVGVVGGRLRSYRVEGKDCSILEPRVSFLNGDKKKMFDLNIVLRNFFRGR